MMTRMPGSTTWSSSSSQFSRRTAPQAAAPTPGPSLLDQLNQLDALHQQGALTDNEFTAAKAKLLGS